METYVITRIDGSTELYHHGTKGQQWGERLYQYKDGSLTPLGRLRYGSDGNRKSSSKNSGSKKVSRKVKKQRLANLEKARQAKAAKKELEEKQKQHEAEKQKAVQSGSAKDLLKFKGELTKQEMDSAWARIQWEQNMSGVAAKEISSGKARADKFFNKVNDITNYANTGIKAWNTVANVYNAFSPNGILPKIDTNITNGNRKEWKAEKKEQKKAAEAQQKRAEQEAQRESKHKERAEKKAKENAKKEPDVERYEATGDDVIGEGTSRFNGWNTKASAKSQSTKSKSTVDLFNDEWSESYVSDLPSTYVVNGRRYLLGNRSGR